MIFKDWVDLCLYMLYNRFQIRKCHNIQSKMKIIEIKKEEDCWKTNTYQIFIAISISGIGISKLWAIN